MSKINFSTRMKPGGGVKTGSKPKVPELPTEVLAVAKECGVTKEELDAIIETHTEVVTGIGIPDNSTHRETLESLKDHNEVREED